MFLKNHFTVTGIDKSSSMLTLAKKLNPENKYICKDMRTFKINSKFDAIVAIDSIAYMLTENDLRKLFSNAYLHLNSGGVFMFLAEDQKEKFTQNNTTSYSTKKGNIEVTFIDNRFDPNPSDTNYESTFIYLVRTNGKLQIFADRHRCGLFDLDLIITLLKKICFKVKLLKYVPPKSAIESSGLSGYIEYTMFICIKS